MRIPRIILTLLVAAGVVVLVVVLLGGASSSGHEIRLNFADADGLLTGSRVEVGGVGVGEVKSLKVTPQDHALVTVSIDQADWPIGRNASAVIRPADLLGEKYIDLTIGNRAEPATQDFTITARHTQTATDFDQIVDVLGPSEQDRLAILIHETGVALYGRGKNVAELLQSLPPSLSDAQSLINQVTASNDQLKGLITHASGVMASLDTNQGALVRFVSTAANAMSATAHHTSDLEQTIGEAPGLLSQLDTTLGRLNVAGANLRPAATGLERTAPALTQTLEELPGFTQAALPTLAEVRSISPQLISLGDRSAPVVAKLKPTLQKLATFSKANKPVTHNLSLGIDNLLGTLQGWARALQTQDGLSHEFRVSAEFPTSFISGLAQGLVSSSTSAAKTPSTSSSSGSQTSGAGGATGSGGAGGTSGVTKNLGSTVSSTVGNLLNGISGTISQLGAGHTSTTASSGSASTTTGSLSNLLGYLLGGK